MDSKTMINFLEKAEDLSYGLMRLAVYARRKDFRSRMEDLAMDLVLQTAKKDYEEALLTTAALEAFLRLGAAIYEVEIVNAQTFIGELQNLQSAMRQAVGFELPEAVNWQKRGVAADGKLDESATSIGNRQSANLADAAIEGVGEEELLPEIADQLPDHRPDSMISIGNTIRQTAILEKIRNLSKKDEFGNLVGCRMKDLLSIFPTVSERTLRYDLQRLLSAGLIERMGNGGATSAYVIK